MKLKNCFPKEDQKKSFFSVARKILLRHNPDLKCQSVLLDIERRKEVLLAHILEKHIPRTNNLIECFNSRLEGRLKTIKGFQSIHHAKLWLNAYFIQRRLKPFTGCQGKFKKLNGKCSLQLAIANQTKFQKLKQKLR